MNRMFPKKLHEMQFQKFFLKFVIKQNRTDFKDTHVNKNFFRVNKQQHTLFVVFTKSM